MMTAREQASNSVATEEEQPEPITGDPEPQDGKLQKAGRFAASVGKGLASIVTSPVQTARSVVRGGVGAIAETANTVGELMALSNRTNMRGAGRLLQAHAERIERTRDRILPPAERQSQQFVEGVSQFMIGFAGTGKFKVFGQLAAKGAAGIAASGAIRGAIVDLTAFDPYEAQLAELAANTNIPGAREVGELLSVTEDDGAVVARLKRAAAGIVPGVAVDAIAAVARVARARRVIDSPAATEAEKAAANSVIEQNGKVLSDIDEGVHQTAEPAFVKQTGNGDYRVHVSEAAEKDSEAALAHLSPEARARMLWGNDAFEDQVERELRAMAQSGQEADRAVAIESVTKDVGDALERRTKQSQFSGPDRRDANRMPREDAAPAAQDYKTRWEAEAKAASLNGALTARAAAAGVKLTTEQTKQIFEFARKIEEAVSDPEKIVNLLKEERFNFSYMDAPDQAEALMKSIGEKLAPVFDNAQGRPSVPASESIDRALHLAGMLTRQDADNYFRNVSSVLKNTDANLLALNARAVDLAEHVSKWGDILEQRSAAGIVDLVAETEARQALRAYIGFAADVAGSNSGVGRGLNALKFRGDPKLKGLKFKGEPGALEGGAKGSLDPDIVAGMTAVQLRDVTRLFRMSKQPQLLFNTLGHELSHASVSRLNAFGRGMMEWFYNSVLSAPATWKAIFVANGTVNAIEDSVRFMAGAVRRDPAMMREAADLVMGRMIYLKQSMKGFALAAKAGHSIIDPRPVYKAIPGAAGEVIRTMGTRPIVAVDEFWRVNSNLAFVRMKSLRLARQDAAVRGLKGKKLNEFLAKRVEADVAASLDPATGASRIPEARQHAALPTFSTPLEAGSFGSSLEKVVQNHPFLIPIMPFMRTSVNVLDYAFGKMTPLGLLQKNMRATLAKGGEEAAILGTRMAVGTAIWSMAGLLAFSGDFTGRGPSDPQQRKMWLKNHEPYAVKMGDKWVSYRRAEPISTPMSFMADLAQILRDNASEVELQEGSTKVMYATFAALVNSMTNKTYMSGLVDFMDAIGSGEGPALKRFMDNMQRPGVPNLVQAFQDDPYLRETQGLFDAFINRVPGWSKTLPARYTWDGEPITLDPSRIERTLNPFPNKDGTPQVEDEILQLHRAFVAPPTVRKFGQHSINLHDRRYQNSKGGNLTPYERWMELIREQDLRGQIEKITSSASYQRSGDGTEVFAGGRKFRELQQRIDRVYNKAEKKMLAEYPELRQDLRGLGRARRASSRSDVKGETILDRLGK